MGISINFSLQILEYFSHKDSRINFINNLAN